MNTRLLMTTAVGLILAGSAFAQSQNETSRTPASPSATQNRMNGDSSSPSPSSSSSMTSPSAQSGPSTKSSAETQSPRPNTTTSQSSPSNATGNNSASRAESDRNAGSSNTQRTDGNSGTTNSRAQSSAPANSPNQAPGSAPASPTNQAQQAPAGGANANRAAEQPNNANTNSNRAAEQPNNANSNTNRTAQQPNNANSNTTAQQPDNRTSTAQSPSSSVNALVNINERERTRVSQSIDRLNVRPLTNVNFSLSVGTVVPRDVRFERLPADVVEIVPQYRGYDFFVVRDEIVIVEPSSYKIVAVMPRSGGSSASSPAPSQRKVTFSDRDREVIRKHARVQTESRTTGSATSTRVRVGDRLPDTVEIESFSDDDYQDAPVLREYRYIHRDNRTYVVEPQERRIIEEID
jgi:hypothetical protein